MLFLFFWFDFFILFSHVLPLIVYMSNLQLNSELRIVSNLTHLQVLRMVKTVLTHYKCLQMFIEKINEYIINILIFKTFPSGVIFLLHYNARKIKLHNFFLCPLKHVSSAVGRSWTIHSTKDNLS